MTRDSLQQLAAQYLAKNKRLILQWATGTGKSRVARIFLETNSWMKGLIVVPEIDNIRNWEDQFAESPIKDNVTIICYASIHKYMDTEWDLLVLDEVPHIDTEKRLACFNTIKAEYVLALGAVVSDEERGALTSLYGRFPVSTISLETAIKEALLPVPTVFVLHMELDNTKKSFFYRGSKYTAKGIYDILDSQVNDAKEKFEESQSEKDKRLMNILGSKRKRFLGEMKEDALKRICTGLEKREQRFICFCSSIKQAKSVGKDHAYTSETNKNERLLERFNSHDIDSLFVVAKLIEGQNLNDISCGVLGQLGGKERITVQSIGRIMRSEEPKIYVPVFDGTKDDYFLTTLTSNIPEEYIKHFKFK